MWLKKWSQEGTCNAKLQLILAHQSLKSRFSADMNYTAPWLGRQQRPSSGKTVFCKSRTDLSRRQSSPKSHRGMGLWEARLLFVALILTGQGCSELLQWDWGDGISEQGNKDNPETNPTLCSVQSAVGVGSEVTRAGCARGSPNTPTVAAASLPGHHSWAGWAGMSRIFG